MCKNIVETSNSREQYLHCSQCWDILGAIDEGEFDLFDVGWPCGNCGRLNKSHDDGQEEIIDSHGAHHIIFTTSPEDAIRIHQLIQPGFSFARIIVHRDLNPDRCSFGQFDPGVVIHQRKPRQK